MSVMIRKPGILTTVQDLGRCGARGFGINPNGAMDRASVRSLNIVVGNPESAAVLEMHFPAAEIEFECDTFFAIGGADFAAELDGKSLRNCTTATAAKGNVLKFTKRTSGQRAYLAVHGGFHVPAWLGSSSTNLAAMIGGHEGRKLAAGDRIECSSSNGSASLTVGESVQPRSGSVAAIRVTSGSEYGLLTAISERDFTDEAFTLTRDCNRMGYRLNGKALNLLHPYELVSAAVNFGTIQLLPDGQIIVLMADHQTSGGYPRIGNVVSVDLPVLAQCGPGDSVRFQIVSIEEAERLAMRFEQELKYLRVGCRLQGQNANC
jgi:antagonist of KipI